MEIQPVSFRWDGDFVDRIDSARGLATRTEFVQQCIEQVLEGGDAAINATLRRVGKRKVAKPRPLSVEGAIRRTTERHQQAREAREG